MVRDVDHGTGWRSIPTTSAAIRCLEDVWSVMTLLELSSRFHLFDLSMIVSENR
jgi:hypothetical protein